MTTKLSLNPQLARMLVAGVLAAAVPAPAAADGRSSSMGSGASRQTTGTASK
jgi:hypothetical protein